ncbi:MAG: hypothetical protein ACI8T1_002122 [Verrucomicrobiales bacterium]|jgi:hypothetical protein
MRITVDIDEAMLTARLELTGEAKKSPAIASAVESFVKRAQAREFGQRIREGQFDYGATHEAQEEVQDRSAE